PFGILALLGYSGQAKNWARRRQRERSEGPMAFRRWSLAAQAAAVGGRAVITRSEKLRAEREADCGSRQSGNRIPVHAAQPGISRGGPLGRRIRRGSEQPAMPGADGENRVRCRERA